MVAGARAQSSALDKLRQNVSEQQAVFRQQEADLRRSGDLLRGYIGNLYFLMLFALFLNILTSGAFI